MKKSILIGGAIGLIVSSSGLTLLAVNGYDVVQSYNVVIVNDSELAIQSRDNLALFAPEPFLPPTDPLLRFEFPRPHDAAIVPNCPANALTDVFLERGNSVIRQLSFCGTVVNATTGQKIFKQEIPDRISKLP